MLGRRLDACRRFLGLLVVVKLVAKDCVELLFQLEASPVQAAANRADRELQNVGNLIVITVINFS